MDRPKFPADLYVVIEYDSEDDEYISCFRSLSEAALLDEKRIVAVYKLDKVSTVVTTVTLL